MIRKLRGSYRQSAREEYDEDLTQRNDLAAIQEGEEAFKRGELAPYHELNEPVSGAHPT